MNKATKKYHHLKYRLKTLDLNFKKTFQQELTTIRKRTQYVPLVSCKILVAKGVVNLAL